MVRIGPPAVAALVNLIGHAGVRARWEATRALCEIRDPAAVPALIGRLEGTDSGIRWMAADGLIGIGLPSVEPLLHALIERSDSVLLRDGARRALHGLAGRDNLQSILQPVIDALDAVEPAVVVPLAAYRALEALRARGTQKDEGITIRRVCVRDWMHPNPVTVRPETTLDEVYRLMQERQIRRVPVVRDGQLVGILLGDVRHGLPAAGVSASGEALQQAAAQTVELLMSRDVLTIRPEATLREAARLMLENKIGGLPVLQGNNLVGIITESDIFRFWYRNYQNRTEDHDKTLQVSRASALEGSTVGEAEALSRQRTGATCSGASFTPSTLRRTSKFGALPKYRRAYWVSAVEGRGCRMQPDAPRPSTPIWVGRTARRSAQVAACPICDLLMKC